jgi:hypothetical protein
MADTYDPYREALIVETLTIWPDELSNLEPAERKRIEEQLHAQPQEAPGLAYVRLHAGFARHITVTAEDIERLKG